MKKKYETGLINEPLWTFLCESNVNLISYTICKWNLNINLWELLIFFSSTTFVKVDLCVYTQTSELYRS